jgi:serine protease AprX
MRIRVRPVRSLVLGLAILAGGVTVQPQTLSKLDPLLQQRLSVPGDQSQIIVTAADASSMDTVGLLIRRAGGTLGRRLPLIDAQVGTVPNASLALLADSPAVQHLALDRRIAGALERTSAVVGATAVRQSLGLDGSGIGVAVIDSGVTPWHDDLAAPTAAGSQRVSQFVDLVDGASTAHDEYGHGTHVAGIIAGNGFDSDGARAGIAPGAHLVVLKVLNESGQGWISDVIAALDYVVAHKADFNIRITNLSIAAGVYESYNFDPLTLAARRVVDEGIVVVAAAGNLGRKPNGDPQYGGITAPGNAPWVLTAGASSHMGTIDRADDEVAAFSSRGPTAFDRAVKPDIVAPGVGTESLSAPGSFLYNAMTPYLLSGTRPTAQPPYLSLSGTSMAAPVVSGTVALMLQANPALTPNAVKTILQYTAWMYPAYDVLTQGAGFLNARGAVELTRFFASPSTTTYPSTSSVAKHVIWGDRLLWGGRLNPDLNAAVARVVWGATTTPSGALMLWDLGPSLTGLAGWGSSGGVASVWGTGDGYSVVWGTHDGYSVVWGTGCTDVGCQPVVWGKP